MKNLTFNETTDSMDDDETVSFLLSAAICVEAILIVLSFWLLTCMIAYGTKTNKWRKNPEEQFLSNRTMFLVCLIAVMLTLPRFAWSIAVIQLPRHKHSDDFCEVIMDITGVTFSMAMCPAYFFLWLRQRALYARPMIRKLAGQWANVFSWSLMAFLTIGSLVMIVVIQAPKSYFAVPQGCVIRHDVEYHTNFYILAGLLVVSQFSLLCLFIYPMLKTRQARRRSEERESLKSRDETSLGGKQCWSTRFLSRLSTKRDATRKQRGVLEKTILRTIVSTIVASISDVTTMAIANFVLPPTLPISIAVALYDVSIVINIFCILATFSSHRRVLLVCCGSLNEDREWQTDTDNSDKRSRRASRPDTVE